MLWQVGERHAAIATGCSRMRSVAPHRSARETAAPPVPSCRRKGCPAVAPRRPRGCSGYNECPSAAARSRPRLAAWGGVRGWRCCASSPLSPERWRRRAATSRTLAYKYVFSTHCPLGRTGRSAARRGRRREERADSALAAEILHNVMLIQPYITQISHHPRMLVVTAAWSCKPQAAARKESLYGAADPADPGCRRRDLVIPH